MHVTVIMPVYNAEKYLYASISSLLSQTTQNWKLICVDDGSTDNSLCILHDFEASDNRIKVLTQDNAGPAVARARAIEFVDTEYVSILDADDAYTPDYVEKMLKRAEETDADIIVPDVICVKNGHYPSKTVFESRGYDKNGILENPNEAFLMSITWKLHGWSMYKTALVKKYYTKEQVEYSRFNSDEYVTRLLFLKGRKIALSRAIYQYNISEGSITRTPSLKMLDYLKTIDKLLQLCIKEKIKNSETMLVLYNEYYQILKNMLSVVENLDRDDKRKGLLLIKEYYHNSYRKNFPVKLLYHAPFRNSVKFILSLISLKVVKCM